jgi:hypothetical protein
MFSLVLVDGHGQAILAVLTEYLRLLLLCVFQLPRSFATPALSVAHSRNLTTPTLSPLCYTCFVCRSLPQPYHTHSFAPLLHLLCLSPTPATLPHPLFRPFAAPALSVAPFSAATAFSLPPRSASLPLSYCKWSSKKGPKTFDHEVESGRKGSGTVVEGGGRPHGMTKKAESVVAPRFFPGGYDGKGRKRLTMK